MTDTTLFFSSKPAWPWSVYPVGLPALVVVALLLVGFTLWAYLGHPQATRRRVILVLALRLGALVVALLTALRPSLGFQEEPKVPSVLLIGIDLSESMTVKDEVNNQARIDAVRRVLDKCQPTLDELAADHNVNVVVYKFGPPDFSPDASKYDPKDPADGKRSDYGTYLNRTFERWQGERFLRGHLIVGDGADNGTAFSAPGEAARFGKRNCPVTTFLVGDPGSNPNAKDLVVAGLSHDPSVPLKTDITLTATVHAYGYDGSKVKARVFFNDEPVATEDVALPKVKDNKVPITVKAPAKPGEVKVRVEVGREGEGGKIEPLPGEVSPLNNFTESYLTVTKEGVRVLLIDRLRWEATILLDALRAEKRFDVAVVWRQTDLPPRPEEAQLLDFENQAYDVVIIGNVSARQLMTVDPGILNKLTERVVKKGMGLMFLGGEAAFNDIPPAPPGDPATRPNVYRDLFPIELPTAGIVDGIDANTKRVTKSFQTVPTADGLGRGVLKIGKDEAESRELWDQLNARNDRRYTRITGYNRFTARRTATVYAWASDADQPKPAGGPKPDGVDPLLVGHQIGEGDRGRVLAFGGYDTYLWQRLGQPKTNQGVQIHHRFWRQCVLWLAHQEEEEGQVYARPETRRLAVGGELAIRVGLKSPAGGDDPTAELDVRILPPGFRPEDEEKAPRQTVVRDPKGAKVLFKPPAPGEYVVVVTTPVKDKDGKIVTGPDGKPMKYRGVARFLAFPDVSDEMIRVAADPDFIAKLAVPTGGKALRLEDLPGFLKELKAQPMDQLKPKPRYVPDWRRNHSKGFLPGWLVVFVALLGTEWALRRVWGMV